MAKKGIGSLIFPPKELPVLPELGAYQGSPINIQGGIGGMGGGLMSPRPFPDSINSLISELANEKLNYGSKALEKVQSAIPQQSLLQGIEKGLNFGVPEIADLQSKAPYVKPFTKDVATTPVQDDVMQQLRLLNDSYGNKIAMKNEELDKPTLLGDSLKKIKNFANSPLGRGLLTAGTIAALGGDFGDAVTYGATAGLKNQQNVNDDKFYRDIAAKSGYDLSSVNGYMDNEHFKSISDIEKLKNDNLYKQAMLQKVLSSSGQSTGYKDIVDVYHSQGLIDDASYNLLTESDSYKNNTKFSASTANKFLEPYLINLRGSNNKSLEGAKQNNRYKIENLKQDNRIAAAKAQEAAKVAAAYQKAYQQNLGSLTADAQLGGTVEGIKALGKEKGKNLADAQEQYFDLKTKMPALRDNVQKLYNLADLATYTAVGQATNSVRRQLGLPVGKKGDARAEYISVIDNQILPLLRITFGAQFTQKEGETLRATLGDPSKSPSEKKAVLRSFINQKEQTLNSMYQKAKMYGYSDNQATQRKQSKPTNSDIEEGWSFHKK